MSRRMASSIRSGPEGGRGVFNSKIGFPTSYFSIDVIFLKVDYLRRIFETGVFLGGRRETRRTPFSLFRTFFTSNFVNEFGIDFSLFLHDLLEGCSPNVPSFFATYFENIFLHKFIFCCIHCFSAKPGDTCSIL